MAWKPKTVAGKLLKGLVIGVGVAGAALAVVGTAGATIPAIGGIITATGGIAGKVLKGAVKTVDAIGSKAADMVSPINKEQRKLVNAQQEETKMEIEKLTAIDKLIKAGSTVQKAAAAVGVPLPSLAGMFGLPSIADAAAAAAAAGRGEEGLIAAGVVAPSGFNVMDMLKKNPLIAGIGALALIFILPKLLKLK